jgi:O-antigen/teichoic acid export membrane protein
MTLTYLVIPLFFIALILYVAWPLLSETQAPGERKAARPRANRKKSKAG